MTKKYTIEEARYLIYAFEDYIEDGHGSYNLSVSNTGEYTSEVTQDMWKYWMENYND